MFVIENMTSSFSSRCLILQAIERITTAKRFFDDHRDMKSAHSAMINIDNMIKRAMLHCVEEMNRIFRSCGSTFKEEKDGTIVVVNPVGEGNTTWLKTICDCLEENQVRGVEISAHRLYSALFISFSQRVG